MKSLTIGPKIRLLVLSLLLASTSLDPTVTALSSTSPSTVQPFTGLVLWQDSDFIDTAPIQLEFAYVGYNEVTQQDGTIDFTSIENRLNAAAKRGHQMILRFYDTYPGQRASVPSHIATREDYKGTVALSEGLETGFPDWGNTAYQNQVLAIMTAFGKKYDKDPRLAYLQVGFGLWSEYHIYDGPFQFGVTFPTKTFQKTFLTHMSNTFKELKWSISIDSANPEIGPFDLYPPLLKLGFGLFDDSFMAEEHDEVNRLNHLALGTSRYATQPIGGEISYYTEEDQQFALSTKGIHGRTFLSQAARYHVSYMLANDQPAYHNMMILKKNSAGLGYRFQITDQKVILLKNSFGKAVPHTRVFVKNIGIAPIHYPAYLQIGKNRSTTSLALLLPGKTMAYDIPGKIDSKNPLTVYCKRLLQNQRIALENLK